MTSTSDAAPLSYHWACAMSADVVSPALYDPALYDVGPWPAAGGQAISGPSLGAGTALELWSGFLAAGGLRGAARVGALAGNCAPSLGLTERRVGSSVVVSVTGEIDIATTAQLSHALGAALRRGAKGLVCDLSGVGFMGAAGVTTLLAARRRAIAYHTWFDLVCPQPLVRRVIALLGLDAVLNLHDSVAAATDAQAQRDGRSGLTTALGAR